MRRPRITTSAVSSTAAAVIGITYVRDLVRQGYVGEVLSTTLIGSGMGWGPTVELYNAYLNDRKNGAARLCHGAAGRRWGLRSFPK